MSADQIRRIIRDEKIMHDTGGTIEMPPAPSRRASNASAGLKPVGDVEPAPQPG
jgi:hypothetical protein